jgi:hypothetical protein
MIDPALHKVSRNSSNGKIENTLEVSNSNHGKNVKDEETKVHSDVELQDSTVTAVELPKEVFIQSKEAPLTITTQPESAYSGPNEAETDEKKDGTEAPEPQNSNESSSSTEKGQNSPSIQNPQSIPPNAPVPSHYHRQRLPPVVADPEPFPNPIIRRSHLRKVNIRISDVVVEQKLVIHSLSGKFYEIGATLKKAIFGHVIHAILLKTSEAPNSDEFVRTNQQMAIKVYSKRMLRQLQGRTQENPLMEITALQYIGNDHPNLMGQIECCTDEENIYSVMRYCQGGELFDFIDENGPLSDDQAKKMFKQLVNGLARLQELGIGHRDMSLENILYDRNDIYVIIDFGMCLRLKKNPSGNDYCFINRQQICGKKNYIAPEVLREDPVFNPMIADIWAAGIILFIILTGVPPIDKATHADIRFTMISEGRLAEMVNNWGIDMKPAVVDLIQRLLKADPMERLTVEEILQHEWMRDA